jgi:hypothetical protein
VVFFNVSAMYSCRKVKYAKMKAEEGVIYVGSMKKMMNLRLSAIIPRATNVFPKLLEAVIIYRSSPAAAV